MPSEYHNSGKFEFPHIPDRKPWTVVQGFFLLLMLLGISGLLNPKKGYCGIGHVQKEKEILFLSGYIQQKELNLVPITHHGFHYSLEYLSSRNDLNLKQFKSSIGFAHMSTPYDSEGFSINLNYRLQYHYLFPAIEKRFMTIWAGPFSSLSYNPAFYPNWDESHLYWTNQLQLGFSSKGIYSSKKNSGRFSWDIQLPLGVLLSRSDLSKNYKMDDFSLRGILSAMHNKPCLAWTGKNLQFQSRIGYSFNLTELRRINLGLQMDFVNIGAKNSRRFVQSCHMLLIGINL